MQAAWGVQWGFTRMCGTMSKYEGCISVDAVRKGTFTGETETPPIKLGKGMGMVGYVVDARCSKMVWRLFSIIKMEGKVCFWPAF